jgi:hypothetical protein
MISQPGIIRRILKPYHSKNGPSPTYWGDYAITYQQGQYFRVARRKPDIVERVIEKDGKSKTIKVRVREIIKNSGRTVYEPFGFFQCAFEKALNDFQIGTEAERKIISDMKEQRDKFSKVMPEIIEYCKLECRLLAQLMERFRKECHDTEMFPKQWAGAGWLAAAMLEQHKVPKRPLTEKEQILRKELADEGIRKREENAAQGKKFRKITPRNPYPRRAPRDFDFEIAANHAFYGGRFEISRVGRISAPVHKYDMKSAYPTAMLDLPCPWCTRWEHVKPGHYYTPPRNKLYLADVTFTHPEDALWCGLPFRKPGGGLIFPREGNGWYWSTEIEASRKRFNARIRYHDVWVAAGKCTCDEHLYSFVRKPYAKRQEIVGEADRIAEEHIKQGNPLGEAELNRLRQECKGRGLPIKLALNSLYGKLAQRRTGQAPFFDAVAAGLITAHARARIIDQVAYAPEAGSSP